MLYGTVNTKLRRFTYDAINLAKWFTFVRASNTHRS